MRDRAILEQHEAERLSPYAVFSRASRGRVHAEDEPTYRTAFQRDRDRIVHSSAFRRLEYKTQVFANDEGDYYRTRLTHTLEVAQIGRTLARTLGVNEDLVETICLAHDLGHPPFGHAGEAALDAKMSGQGGFNHNQHSFRLVTELEHRYPHWPGLNLTLEALSGMVAHQAAVPVAQSVGFDPALRGTVEAQIADITDQLAYNAHDLDDGLISGILTPEMLREVDAWRMAGERVGYAGGPLDEVTRHTIIRELIGLFTDDVVSESARRLAVFAPADADAVTRLPDDVVCYSPPIAETGRALKAFLYAHMYHSSRIVRMQRRAERFLSAMFDAFMVDPRQLPPECFADIDVRGVYRVVADYIAGMTDRSAILEYRRLFDPMMRP
jgi:dGTPase